MTLQVTHLMFVSVLLVLCIFLSAIMVWRADSEIGSAIMIAPLFITFMVIGAVSVVSCICFLEKVKNLKAIMR